MPTTAIKTPLVAFAQREEKSPNRIFLRQPINGNWHTYTWQQVGQEARKIAAAINALDLAPQSKIGLVSKNCAHWIMADLAIMMSGHISVPLYPNIGAETINYVLQHSEAKVLIIGKLDDWNAMKSGVPKDVHCISFPFYGPDGYVKWEDLTGKYDPISELPERNPKDIMTIIYTSGTTGTPKGVVHNFHALSYALTHALEEMPLDSTTRFFSYLPLSHVAEKMLVEMGVLYTGGQVYFAQSLETFAENLKEARPTIFLAVPRIWTKFQLGILSKLPQAKLDKLLSVPILSSFIKRKIKKSLGLGKTDTFISGAAPIPASQLKWYKKIGINIQEVYGMTENCAYSHLARKDNVKYGYVGQPMPNCDVKISDEGEILVKSECNMIGYYKEPEMTTDTFEEGFLKTGDKGEIDEQGFLKITGRIKDIFKTEKGKYVAPSPIELHLLKNKFIEQVCVIGSGMPQPMALVVLAEGVRKINKEEIVTSLTQTVEIVNATVEKHERLHKAIVVKEAWTLDNKLMTPTLKIKRLPIEGKYGNRFKSWYDYKEVVIWEE